MNRTQTQLIKVASATPDPDPHLDSADPHTVVIHIQKREPVSMQSLTETVTNALSDVLAPNVINTVRDYLAPAADLAPAAGAARPADSCMQRVSEWATQHKREIAEGLTGLTLVGVVVALVVAFGPQPSH